MYEKGETAEETDVKRERYIRGADVKRERNI
jgi:hypothetical protein